MDEKELSTLSRLGPSIYFLTMLLDWILFIFYSIHSHFKEVEGVLCQILIWFLDSKLLVKIQIVNVHEVCSKKGLKMSQHS